MTSSLCRGRAPYHSSRAPPVAHITRRVRILPTPPADTHRMRCPFTRSARRRSARAAHAVVLLGLAVAAAPTPARSQAPADTAGALRGARSPAFSVDGRLAVSIDGDLWAQRGDGVARTWARITSGAEWDREAVWTADGAALVFSSNRGGRWSIWRIAATGGREVQAAERVTSTGDDDFAPTIASDGRIAFVRGRGAMARIWVRSADGSEKRLTSATLPEQAPAFAPNGAQVAYTQTTETGRSLRVRTLATNADVAIVTDRAPERIAWSPDGSRLAFSSAGGRSGVFVTPTDGRWINIASLTRGDPAWAPDGRTIAIAERTDHEPGYNGDPDRLGERVSERLNARDRLLFVDAPASPDAGRAERNVAAPRDRLARNAESFDRAWERTATLYYAGDATRHAQWETLRTAWRPRALAAATDSALDAALHAMLQQRPPLRVAATGRAAVTSAHAVATEAGLEILRAGGNVVDAAVAVSFALGVVEPDASGVGGYGQMVVQLAGWERPRLIEFMARVPEDAGLGNASLLDNGRYPGDGPVLAIVPGTVAGMHKAFTQWGSGKVTWKALLAPAIRAARDGYAVSDGLATTLATERAAFAKYAGSRALFWRNGEPLHAGDTIRNPDLAATLERIADGGADGFYKGDVARRLVSDLRSHGNPIKLTDMARYFAAERDPVMGTYRGYALYSSAPPVSGGATLVSQLNLLEQFPAPKLFTDDAATMHAFLSAWMLGPSQRGRIADPSLWPVNTDAITSKDTARARWKCFDANRAPSPRLLRGDALTCGDTARRASPSVPGGDLGSRGELESASDARAPWLTPLRDGCGPDDHAAEAPHCRAMGTTSFAVADAEGNAVAVTQTLGTWGGGFYVSPGLGFLYNDKLTSYPTDPNGYGARLPFARHGSIITPTIVMRDRRPVFVVGAAGNAWISSAVYAAVVGALDFKLDPQRALELPRVLPAGRFAPPGSDSASFAIDYEDGFSPGVIRQLERLGWTLRPISLRGELRMGYGAAIALDAKKVTAGADPRRAGAAGAIP